MPVAVRLIEVLAIVALVATMAAGAAVVIFLEKLLLFLLLVTDPLITVVNFLLGIVQYIFLRLINRLTKIMEHLTSSLLWKNSSSASPNCKPDL